MFHACKEYLVGKIIKYNITKVVLWTMDGYSRRSPHFKCSALPKMFAIHINLSRSPSNNLWYSFLLFLRSACWSRQCLTKYKILCNPNIIISIINWDGLRWSFPAALNVIMVIVISFVLICWELCYSVPSATVQYYSVRHQASLASVQCEGFEAGKLVQHQTSFMCLISPVCAEYKLWPVCAWRVALNCSLGDEYFADTAAARPLHPAWEDSAVRG